MANDPASPAGDNQLNPVEAIDTTSNSENEQAPTSPYSLLADPDPVNEKTTDPKPETPPSSPGPDHDTSSPGLGLDNETSPYSLLSDPEPLNEKKSSLGNKIPENETENVTNEGSLSYYQRAIRDSTALEDLGTGFISVQDRFLDQTTVDTIVSILYLSVFAILGAILRIGLAQLFGGECSYPGTVGWLKTEAALCVTAYGETLREGGIIYADIPSNMLGSFIMGLILSGSALGLHVDIPFAVAPVNSQFQSWNLVHLGIRTGFCGALTTYSSWNSEMVVMIFGTGSNYPSQWIRALFGYVIGVELALSSFTAGKNMAIFYTRWAYPSLTKEADAIADNSNLSFNKRLPGLERRFLAGIIDENELNCANPDLMDDLEIWKDSTATCRSKQDEVTDILHDVEKLVIVDRVDPIEKYGSVIVSCGWDIKALERWASGKQRDIEQVESPRIWPAHELYFVGPIFLAFVLVLVLGVLVNNEEDAYSLTYRSMWYSALWAPLGALLRWYLSGFNQSLDGSLSWLPLGTLMANVLGSIISIAMIASEIESDGYSYFFGYGTMGAVKVGFAGSLSTVSTFVSEVTTLMKGFPRNYHGYLYIAMSLFLSCLCGIVVYSWVLYVD